MASEYGVVEFRSISCDPNTTFDWLPSSSRWIRCCSSSRRDTPLLFVLLLFNSISELVMLWLLLVVLFESVAMCGTIVGGTLALHFLIVCWVSGEIAFPGNSHVKRRSIAAQVHTRHYLFLFLALTQHRLAHTLSLDRL